MRSLRPAVTGTLTAAVVAAVLPVTATAAHAASSTWQVTCDPVTPAAACTDVRQAAAAWATVFPSDQPVRVAVSWQAPVDPAQLAVGTPADMVVHDPDTGVLYPVALEEAIAHTGLNDGDPDITVALSSTAPWGTDPGSPSPSTYDLTTFAMRALGTGLGLGSGTRAVPSGSGWTGSYGSDDDGDGLGDGSYPPVYDAFVAAAAPYPAALLDYANRTTALGAALTGGRLTWTGPAATLAAGSPPVLYAPTVWSPLRSVSYLDESRYPQDSPDALMTPVLKPGEVIGSPGPIASAMVQDMLSSPGGAGAPVRHYVNALYHAFLQRDADPGGLTYYTQQLVTGGLDRGTLTTILSQSPEYLTTQVRGLYTEVLGRSGDDAGVNGWVQAIRNGTPIATVGAAFYASDENYARTGGTASDPGPWVEGLYTSLLGRPSDPDGKAYWVAAARSQGRLFVTTSFYGSQEKLVRRVNGIYLALLDRDADPTGLSGWPPVIAARGDLALAATIATSQEFFNRAQLFPLPA